MKEYGGYIELDTYRLPMLHEGAVALNCGRSCLAWLIRAKQIRRLCIPAFLCDSVENLCRQEGVAVRHYAVGMDLLPEPLELEPDEWLYLVNYYGQLTDAAVHSYKERYQRVMVDNSQAYFQMPAEGVDTFYTCRKFFGVADGAFLYTDAALDEELPRDESFGRMQFLLGRFERSASEFYSAYGANNRLFAGEPVKRMSRLTENLLHGIDYAFVRQRRTENFRILSDLFAQQNRLTVSCPEGAFAYPLLLENGPELRAVLAKQKIYIPTLWPNVLQTLVENRTEWDMAANILPLPCDQRYGKEDMEYIAGAVFRCMEENG